MTKCPDCDRQAVETMAEFWKNPSYSCPKDVSRTECNDSSWLELNCAQATVERLRSQIAHQRGVCPNCGYGPVIALPAPPVVRFTFDSPRGQNNPPAVVEHVTDTAPQATNTPHDFTIRRDDGGLSCEVCGMPETYRLPCRASGVER